MRLAISPRLSRLVRRLPHISLWSITEFLLLALLAVQCARLFWAFAAPIGPVGDWRPSLGPDAARGRAMLASGFDPFFRAAGGNGPAVVTSLQLKLFGVRVDEATGRGSAIIAGPDNVQTSYSVGETILPGVILKSVAYDSVVIERGGVEETLYLDQSAPAAALAPPAPPPVNAGLLSAPATITNAPAGLSLAELQGNLMLSPRQSGDRVTGLVPQGDPAFLARLGLQPGDMIVQVSGRPVLDPDDLQRAAIAVKRGGSFAVAVERGAKIVPVAISISGQ